MTVRLIILLFSLLSLGSTYSAEIQPLPKADDFSATVLPLLNQFCTDCHSTAKSKGGVNLAPFTNGISIYRDIRLWERVAAKVRDRDMPPESKPQPSTAERIQLTQWVEKSLKDLDDGRLPADPGRVLIHRLSRAEYNCTIRDLLGVDSKPANNFPSEGGGGGGFDNNADTLFIPPILMERYLKAAVAVLDQADSNRIFFVKKSFFTSDRQRARKIISHFTRLGFRRPAEREEIDRLVNVYDEVRHEGKSFELAVKGALTGILVSPNFLFRVEREQNSLSPYRISDFELASRLSYFLWSSLPDDELLRLAEHNQLHESAVLEAQVHRLIIDPKSRVFTDNFAGQWLRVRDLKTTSQPDHGRFPEFTTQLRNAMYQEVIEFFDYLVREDQSLLNLLQSDHTFMNGELAKFYGTTNVSGESFQRVSLNDPNRGGVLSMAAVLTLTSYPFRTSPVLRGKWILEEILGTPTPPPPPQVKTLSQDDAKTDGLTFRQQLEKHREDRSCAACHEQMDPLGFGLENFDAIGRWRTKIGAEPVDASGMLPGGEKFAGADQLKQILLRRKGDFSRNLTEKMLAYALGRGLEYFDVPTVKKISRTLAENDYRASTLIVEIVKSYPFQFRRNEPVQTAAK